jgi:hypothetical protein
MAQIDLRYATIRLKDGFTGTALVNESSPANADTTLVIDTVANLPDDGTVVYTGVRFTHEDSDTVFTVTDHNENQVDHVVVDASSGNWKYTVNGQQTGDIAYNALTSAVKTALVALSNVGTDDVDVTGSAGAYDVEWKGVFAGVAVTTSVADHDLSGGGDTVTKTTLHPAGTTWKLTFTPALATAQGLPDNNDAITFLPAQVEINIGEGNLTWTEKREINYKLNRGVLSTVVQGDDQPMEVNTEFLYEFYTSNADGFNPTPIDFIKRTGSAAHLASSSNDPCEMFAVDMEVEYVPPCGSQDPEVVTFPDFRYEQIEADLKNGTFSISGKCNAVEPIVERTV